MTDVAVVICTYSAARWDDLTRAVASVRSQQPAPRRIVVVSDGDQELLRRVNEELPGVTGVINEGQRGLSGARNAGIAATDEEVVAFIDDDAEAQPGWLAALAEPYSEPLVAGVGGAVEPRWDRPRPSWFPEEFDWVVGCSYRGSPTIRSRQRNFIGANMSFRRGVFEEAGGFVDGIGRVGSRPVGCEETELCLRIASADPSAQLLHEPAARVSHRVPADRATWSYFVRRCWSEGLSKAAVTRLHGSGSGLASERSYTARVLPQGFFGSLLRGVPARAGAIAVGLLATSAGYVVGALRERGGR